MTIIKPSTAFKSGADWVSAEVRAYITDQVATHVDLVQDVRDNDFEQTRFLYVRTKAATYRLDLSSGAADDGDTVLRDNVGRRYVKVAGSGSAMAWDVQVDDLAARAAYDGEDEGFSVLVADIGDGRAAVYERIGAAGNWTDPAFFSGPAGAPGVGDRFDLPVWLSGRPRAGETFPRVVLAGEVTFPPSLSGSIALAGVAATDESTFSLRKNDAEFATVTFAASSDEGVFSSLGASFTAGDVLSVVAPSPRDDTLADISITISGSR